MTSIIYFNIILYFFYSMVELNMQKIKKKELRKLNQTLPYKRQILGEKNS